MSDKIQTTHLERRAVVYLRQSTLKQVHEHRESTVRQYALRQRALELGWSAEQIDIIDEDLGRSGTSAVGRAGFQRLAEQIAAGRVGAIFALEVSRLARSSADWHQMLELCALADVLIADEQAVYTPRDYNDRLLLGLKGTMSEAEQYWMRLRLQGGKLSKARRGELRLPAPIGYEWDEATGRFRLDPDEQVQRAVRLVFERFRFESSAYAVMRYLGSHGLKLPMHDPRTHELKWVVPKYGQVLHLLHNPVYAGAYVFGLHETRTALVDGHLRRGHSTKMPQQAWKVCLKDHHPAYISWEEYMANQKKFSTNRANHRLPDRRGAAREGHALLQGLALCGRCGRRMVTLYRGSRQHAYYQCHRPPEAGHETGICWTVSAAAIDQAVAQLFLQTVQPPELELSLAVAREADRQASELAQQWKLRLERARYEAQLAERRYKNVDPDMRVVARTLEREWNEKLSELASLEQEYQEVLRQKKVHLTDKDRARLLALARDLPSVWRAQSTTHAERKNLLRTLVREVVLSPVEVPERMTRVQVVWETGMTSDFTVPRLPLYMRVPSPETIARVRQLLRKGMSDKEIVEDLNRRGVPAVTQRAWNIYALQSLRRRHGIVRWHKGEQPIRRPPERRADGLYSVHGVAATLGVTEAVVHSWIEQGKLQGVEGGGQGRPWWFKLDRATLKRLKASRAQGSKQRGRNPSKKPREEEGHYA
jgi:DNA invertase Pin-like site-specific DNA recombinase